MIKKPLRNIETCIDNILRWGLSGWYYADETFKGIFFENFRALNEISLKIIPEGLTNKWDSVQVIAWCQSHNGSVQCCMHVPLRLNELTVFVICDLISFALLDYKHRYFCNKSFADEFKLFLWRLGDNSGLGTGYCYIIKEKVLCSTICDFSCT